MRYYLTPNMKKLIAWLEEWPHEYGPSYMDICRAMGYKHKSQAHQIVHSLVKKGVIEITPGVTRSVRLVCRK